jgi:hypothetical protein
MGRGGFAWDAQGEDRAVVVLYPPWSDMEALVDATA